MLNVDNHGLEKKVVDRFCTAFAALWRYEEHTIPADPQISVMFTYGPRAPDDEPVDYSDLVAQTGMDLVILEFAPGAERQGPWNIVVHVRNGNNIDVLERCVFWEDENGRVRMVVPDDREYMVGFDGNGLRQCPVKPGDDLDAGRARARLRLRMVTDDLEGVAFPTRTRRL